MEVPWAPGPATSPKTAITSGLGIASITIALLSIVSLFDFAAIMFAWKETAQTRPDNTEPVRIALMIWCLSLVGLWLIGIICGICGLLHRNRRRGIPAIG